MGARLRRHVRALAATGMGLAALMPLTFFVIGFDRGGVYLALQLLGAVAFAVAAWGLLRGGGDGALALALALGWTALSRLLHVLLDLTRLPPLVTLGLIVTWTAAAIFAGLLAARPTAKRAAGLRASLWAASFALFLAAFTALSHGRLAGLLGLTLGFVGVSLAAPYAADE